MLAGVVGYGGVSKGDVEGPPLHGEDGAVGGTLGVRKTVAWGAGAVGGGGC